ncbi:barstar family protein [Kitasatospora sp. MAP5-34]|uniref:barstar family protein n=1 Tax=Kitasatospora sp. MAP5-34 TaxID=3035102 RepID=UPI0024770A8A|nr:barstar family protein [Kitasatospora sp. MAP5-34]MDH6574939.1 RNAse (barnase) inhibitor barstar [Kitasatospora sp. MAP5-34]
MPQKQPSLEYHLDGAAVADEPSFYAALGSAVRAPDGYYGRNLDALVDCLRGGFGPEPPFTLLWDDSAAARRALTRRLVIEGREQCYFDAVLDVLREGGVTVVLR